MYQVAKNSSNALLSQLHYRREVYRVGMPRVRRGGPVVVLLKFRVVCSGCQQHAGSLESHCEPITLQIKGKRAFGSSIPPRAPWEHMNC